MERKEAKKRAESTVRIYARVAVDKAKHDLNELKKEIKASADEMVKIKNGLGGSGRSSFPVSEARKFERAISDSERRIADLKRQLEELKNVKGPTAEFTRISEELDKAYETIGKYDLKAKELINKLGLPADTDPSRVMSAKATADFQAACATADELQAKYDKLLESGKALTEPRSSKQYQDVQSKLTEAESTLSKQVNAYEFAQKKFDRASARLANAQGFQRMAANASAGLARLKGALHSVANITKRIISPVISLGKAFAKFVGNRAVSHVNRLKKHLDLTHSALGRFVKRVASLAKRIFIFSVILRAFRAIRNAFSEGIGYYLSWDKKLASSVENLKNQVLMLKATFGGAFAPILEIVVPILSKLVGWLTTATNAIGAFIARLTGKSTYKSVVAMTADSGKQAASSVGDATKAVKELKKELADYDELHVISKDEPDAGTSSGGGTGGGTDASGPSFVYKDVEIGDDIKKLADKIKEMWERADFTELGGILGDKLKEGLERIPWPKIQEGARKVAKSLATFINGFVESEGLGYTVGQTIGQGLNTALTFARTFVDELHFSSIGAFIRDGINGFLDSIHWVDAYYAAQKYGGGIADLLNNLFDPITAGKAGRAVGNALDVILHAVEGFVYKINPENIGKTISAFWQKFTDKTHEMYPRARAVMGEAGSKLATLLNNIITPENLTRAANLISELVNVIVHGLKRLLEKSDFKNWGKAVGDAIMKMVTDIKWREVGNVIGLGLQKMLDFVKGLLSRLRWADIKNALSQLWKGIAEKVDMETVAKIMAVALGAILTKKLLFFIGANVIKGIGLKIALGLGGSISTGMTTALPALLGAALVLVLSTIIAGSSGAKILDFGKQIANIIHKGFQGKWDEIWKDFDPEEDIPYMKKLKEDRENYNSTHKYSEMAENSDMYINDGFSARLQNQLKEVLGTQIGKAVGQGVQDEVNRMRFGITISQFKDGIDQNKKVLEKGTMSLFKTKDDITNQEFRRIGKGVLIADNADVSKVPKSDKEMNDGKLFVNKSDESQVPKSDKEMTDGKLFVNKADPSNVPSADKTMNDGKIVASKADPSGVPLSDKTMRGGKVLADSADATKVPKSMLHMQGGKVYAVDADMNGVPDYKQVLKKGKVEATTADTSKVKESTKVVKGGSVEATTADTKKVPKDTKVEKGLLNVVHADITRIPPQDKVLGNSIAKATSADMSGVKEKDKIIDKSTARITKKDDQITDRTFQKMTANITKKVDQITDRTFQKMIANVTKKTDGISDRTFERMTANITRKNDNISDKNLFNFRAYINKYTDDVSGKKYLNYFQAWITSYADDINDNYKVLKNFQAWVSSYAEKAKGGIFSGGTWTNLPQYATGGRPDHGTVFMAGENGAEVVGTVGGRTEVLNKSQIAMAMYSAVKSAMSGFGRDIVSQVAYDTSVLVGRIDRIPGYIPDVNQIQKANMAVAKVDAIDYGKLAQALSQGGSDSTYVFTANLDGREIFRQTVTQNDLYKSQTGRSAFA